MALLGRFHLIAVGSAPIATGLEAPFWRTPAHVPAKPDKRGGCLKRAQSTIYIDIARLSVAGIWFRSLVLGLKSFQFLPAKVKRPRIWGFLAILVPLVPSVWPENACVMPNSKTRLSKSLASKNPFNGFLR